MPARFTGRRVRQRQDRLMEYANEGDVGCGPNPPV